MSEKKEPMFRVIIDVASDSMNFIDQQKFTKKKVEEKVRVFLLSDGIYGKIRSVEKL